MGITFRIGSSSTRTFGLGLRRHADSRSQEAPSRYRPLTKQPECALSVTSSAVLYLVTVVYNVERSNGQPFLRQVACTRAVKYDSGMCRPDNQITAGSPSLTYKQNKRKHLTRYCCGGICVEKGPDLLTVLHLEPPRVSWTEWSASWSEIIRVISMISKQNCTTQSSITRLYYSHFETTEFSQYQYFIDQVAGLLKSGNKKTFTSHFVFETEMMRYRDKMVQFRTRRARFGTNVI